MEKQFNFSSATLEPLTQKAAEKISQWEYAQPYHAYSFKGHDDAYLLDEDLWGVEQFCLTCDGKILGQVACQYEENDLWVGWSMAPDLCGKGSGAAFVKRCVQEICRIKKHKGRLLLRVAAWNKRAIKAYSNAGFRYVETILDEIAFSDNMEDFWVMEF